MPAIEPGPEGPGDQVNVVGNDVVIGFPLLSPAPKGRGTRVLVNGERCYSLDPAIEPGPDGPGDRMDPRRHVIGASPRN